MPKANLEKDAYFLRLVNRGLLQVYKTGRVKNASTGKYLGYKHPTGYQLIWSENRTILVHRLVWIAFKGLISDDSLQINHLDGNKMNNRLDNLELVTAGENLQHAYDNGLKESSRERMRGVGKSRRGISGENHPRSKLTDRQVKKMRLRYNSGGVSMRKLAEEFGVALSSVHGVLSRKHYPKV